MNEYTQKQKQWSIATVLGNLGRGLSRIFPRALKSRLRQPLQKIKVHYVANPRRTISVGVVSVLVLALTVNGVLMVIASTRSSQLPAYLGMLAYDEDAANNTTPHYRFLNGDGTDLGKEQNMLDEETSTEEVNHTIIKAAPTRDEFIRGSLTSAGHLDVQVFKNGEWINGTNAPTDGEFTTAIGTTNDAKRGFDIAYEAVSGDGIVIYESSSTADKTIKYRTWDGSSWSAEQSLDYSAVAEGGANAVAGWIKVESDFDSNNILLGWQDVGTGGFYGANWTGSTWQHITLVDAAGYQSFDHPFHEQHDVTWEGTSGDGMMIYFRSGNDVRTASYNTTTGFAASISIITNGATFVNVSIAGSPNNDYIAMMLLGGGGSTVASDVYADMWNGSDWTTIATPTFDDDVNTYGFAHAIDVAWEQASGADRALFVWRDGTTSETSLRYMVFDVSVGQFLAIDDDGAASNICNLTGAATNQQVTSMVSAEGSNGPCSGLGTWAGTVTGIVLRPDPNSRKIALIAENQTVLDLRPEMHIWNGTDAGTWMVQTTNMGAFETDASTGALPEGTLPTMPYDFAWKTAGGKFTKLSQTGYIWENDDKNDTDYDGNTQQVAGSTAISSVKRGERLSLRMQIKNTGDAELLDDLGLFYDRGDGIFTKVSSAKPSLTSAGNCSNTDFDCATVDDTGTNTGSYAATAISNNGQKWVSYYDTTNTSLRVAVSVGTGGNCSSGAWQCYVVDNDTDDTGQFSSIALDSNGKAWVSYYDATLTQLMVAQFVGTGGTGCGASGSTAWTCEAVDNTGATLGSHTAIVVDAKRNPWVSYYNADANTGVKVATRGGDYGVACTDTDWTCNIVYAATSSSNGQFTSIAISPRTDNPWISVYDVASSSLMVAEYIAGNQTGGSGTGCGATGSTAWNCETVDNTGTDTGKYTSIAFAPDGTPWVSYYDTTNSSLRVAARSAALTTTCTDGDWTCVAVDSTGIVGLHTSIAFAPNGAAWVSYYDDDATATNKALKYARYVGSSGTGCDGASWACATVDNSGADAVGEYSSLAFAPDGTAWISYYDGGSETALKLANIKRGGEIVISSGLANRVANILESHADMTSVTDTANRDDADCIGGGTWNNGKWSETENITSLSLPAGSVTAQCIEVTFMIDTSQAVGGTTYRFVVASRDGFREDKGNWRGPTTVSAYATLSLESATNMIAAKTADVKFSDCTNTSWGCATVQDLAANADYISMAVDPSGKPWAAFRGTDGTNGTLVVAQYVGGTSGSGCTNSAWKCVTVDDPTNSVGSETSIAFDHAGNPWVTYLDATATDVKVAQYVGGTSGTGCTSTAWTCTFLDSQASDIGTSTSIVFDDLGRAWVSYGDYSLHYLKVAKYVGTGGTGCSSTAWSCTIVDDPASNNIGSYSSIAFDSQSNPWISYWDFTANSLKVANYVGFGGSGCGNGSTAWTCTTVHDPTNIVGEYTSLAFDASGNAWVSYRDTTAGALLVAKYVGSGGAGCTSTAWTCTTIEDVASSVGEYTSLAFDAVGTAWISYKDGGSSGLRVAKYVGSGGAGCTSSTAWTCTTIESGGNVVGNYTSLAFDTTGNVWIAYRDVSAAALKITKTHLPPSSSQVAKIAYRARSAGIGLGMFRLDSGLSPRTSTCSATADFRGYCGIAADDTDFDSVSATNGRPTFTFTVKNSSPASMPTATWIGRTNIAPSTAGTTGDLKLQVYNRLTQSWVDMATNSTSSDCSTADCTLSAQSSGNPEDYYEPAGNDWWIYFRVWQYENTNAETLKTDYFNVGFEQTGSKMRHGARFLNNVESPLEL